MRPLTRIIRYLIAAGVLALILVACGAGGSVDEPASTSSSRGPSNDPLVDLLSSIGTAVEEWRNAESIEDAHIAAERAANLVVGPNGPGYGDRNADGVIAGETSAGLLSGLDGTPEGVASRASSNPCVTRDVLGGTWGDPRAAWGEMLSAIETWEPGNNTMPTLPSHPMRVVGWATFTLATDSIDLAHEYAGHARLHVDISMRALDC